MGRESYFRFCFLGSLYYVYHYIAINTWLITVTLVVIVSPNSHQKAKFRLSSIHWEVKFWIEILKCLCVCVCVCLCVCMCVCTICNNCAHLVFVRFEHSLCRRSLVNTYDHLHLTCIFFILFLKWNYFLNMKTFVGMYACMYVPICYQ